MNYSIDFIGGTYGGF